MIRPTQEMSPDMTTLAVPSSLSLRRPKRTARRGFTLLEIIVVVTIIALLATIVAPNVFKRVGQSKQAKAQAEVARLYQEINLWMLDNGYSSLPEGFTLRMLTEGDRASLRASAIIDPWGNEYRVVNPGRVNPDFDVMSYGADNQPGGEGENADVVN